MDAKVEKAEAKHTPGPWIRPTCALHMLEHIKSPREDRRQYGVKCLIELYAERKDLLAALAEIKQTVALLQPATETDSLHKQRIYDLADAAIAKAGQ